MTTEAKCPYSHAGEAKCPYLHPGNGTTNKDWWPEAISLKILNQHNDRTDPMPSSFNYRAEFEKLDLTSLKSDLTALMTDSQDFWPADYGHYGPFFIRMACKYISCCNLRNLFYMQFMIYYIVICSTLAKCSIVLNLTELKYATLSMSSLQGTAQEPIG
jgi:hypothetical protein